MEVGKFLRQRRYGYTVSDLKQAEFLLRKRPPGRDQAVRGLEGTPHARFPIPTFPRKPGKEHTNRCASFTLRIAWGIDQLMADSVVDQFGAAGHSHFLQDSRFMRADGFYTQ